MKRLLILIATVVSLSAPPLSWGNNNLLAGGAGASNLTWEIRASNGGFVSSGNLQAGRDNHCAVRLSSGNAFIGGGQVVPGTWEIRNTSGGLVSNGNLAANRDFGFTCTLLADGNVMIVGGQSSLGSWEIRNSSGGLVSSGTLFGPRYYHTATLLSSGNVLIAGGQSALGSWEIRNSTGGFVSSGSLWAGRTDHCAVGLSNGNVFIGDGSDAPGTWEIRNGNGGFVSSGSLYVAHYSWFTCNRLLNGNVFIAGGTNAAGFWEIRDPTLMEDSFLMDFFGLTGLTTPHRCSQIRGTFLSQVDYYLPGMGRGNFAQTPDLWSAVVTYNQSVVQVSPRPNIKRLLCDSLFDLHGRILLPA